MPMPGTGGKATSVARMIIADLIQRMAKRSVKFIRSTGDGGMEASVITVYGKTVLITVKESEGV